MTALNKRQGVKINAALSMIYHHGYDAQTVVGWAREYQQQGYPMAKSYERALNEFIAGQPELGGAIVRINRLIHASDDATVDQYESAINQYIENGDGSAIETLGPVIARDSVELARRNGELADGSITPEAVQSALGIGMADHIVQAAKPEPQSFAFKPQEQAPPLGEDRYASGALTQGSIVAHAAVAGNGAQMGGQPYSSRQARMDAASGGGVGGPSLPLV
jgi:hypothetical protein